MHPKAFNRTKRGRRPLYKLEQYYSSSCLPVRLWPMPSQNNVRIKICARQAQALAQWQDRMRHKCT